MTERMKTEAERRLHDSIEALDTAAVRKQRVGCEGIPPLHLCGWFHYRGAQVVRA